MNKSTPRIPDTDEIHSLKSLFERELFENIIPFWETHSPDDENGGYFNCLDREGKVYDTTKHVWLQARQVWMFSKFYNEVEQKSSWFNIAKSGMNFLRNHAVRDDGRLYFSVSKTGSPVWIQRKIFSECFYIIALSEFGKASERTDLQKEARQLFERVWYWSKDLSRVDRPQLEGAPKTRSLAIPMILLNVIDELTDSSNETFRTEINECINRMLLHLHRDKQTVFETVGINGEYINSSEGRLLNPGHAIEAGWFLHRWSDLLIDKELQTTAVQMIRWAHDRGWDNTHGGIFYFLDYEGYSPTQLEWFMKLWWPHNEAMIGHLYNFIVTRDIEDWNRFKQVQEYAFSHFSDPEYGGWFGYLNREGEVTHKFKGAPYKGFFHVPRSLWICIKLLNKLETELDKKE